ncbi:hypothetical protein [Paramaledivibacter caminithermalis]|uniref:S-layer homology domain-containing protein n=1 Tax=Paramaledivibacter caminithermalis (strain DSM 15212 / CIP 107654 / DViRD3) TaxID=1121301 RepID=A0A1M6SH09_PARC5|nr:hypothetical protein [Paramaledivibacter caminithermalis]SHK43956.1 hypothetical protein SAMN02745912_03311 [Paramaledivibacter caminithermalis DSM 15212]
MKKITILLISMLIIVSAPLASFANEQQFTKAEFIKEVLDAAGVKIDKTSEIESLENIDKEYIPYIEAAYKKGIISEDEKPDLNDVILKQEAAKILVKAFAIKGNIEDITEEMINKELEFTDNHSIDPKVKKYIAYGLRNDIIEGNKESFYPMMILTKEISEELIDYAKNSYDKHFIRDGIAADKLLVLANKKLEEDKTYRAKGSFNMNMTMNVEGLPAEDEIGQELLGQGMNMDMTTELDMQAESPDKAYIKQVIKSDTEEVQSENTIEIYMDGPTMYQKMDISGDKWIKNDMSSVYNKIQSLQANNPQSMSQLSDEQIEFFKDYARYGENVKKGGKEYYVILLDIDKETYKRFYEEYTKEIMDASLEASLKQQSENNGLEQKNEVEIEMAKQFVTQMINDMEIEVSYKFYINKNTKHYEKMDLTMDMYMNMDNLIQKMAQMFQDEDEDLSKIKMEMVTHMEGQFDYFGFGKEVVFPKITEDDIFNMEDALVPQN